MNLPNKLTVMRVVLVPFFVAAALIDFKYHDFVALAIFAIASVTDFLDGYIARKNNLVTDFGKFLDPLADKVLVIAALVCLMEKTDIVTAVPVIIILAREFMVSGLRLVTADKGVVVPADIWGKLKTAFTMGSIVIIYTFCGLFGGSNAALTGWATANDGVISVLYVICIVLVWISTLLTIISGVNYLRYMSKYIETN